MTDERLTRRLRSADVPEVADPCSSRASSPSSPLELGFVGQALEGTGYGRRSAGANRSLAARGRAAHPAGGRCSSSRAPPCCARRRRIGSTSCAMRRVRIAVTRAIPRSSCPAARPRGLRGRRRPRDRTSAWACAAEVVVRDDGAAAPMQVGRRVYLVDARPPRSAATVSSRTRSYWPIAGRRAVRRPDAHRRGPRGPPRRAVTPGSSADQVAPG